jgi:phosphoenolpyruvate synthase/pyruvate phosphate dikinase
VLRRVQALHEFNPMLGLRGCRLGILYPEINEMQVRAILLAAVELNKEEHIDVVPEIMIPLIGHADELRVVHQQLKAVADEVIRESGIPVRRALHVRDDDRDPTRLHRGGRDRRDGGVLLIRHQRPDADDLRIQPR